MYTMAKQRRDAQEQASARLGYLQWKAEWWGREFDRLKGATGLVLDFDSLTKSGVLDTAPIERMVGRYADQTNDVESLERFLDTVTQSANALMAELFRLRDERAATEREQREGARADGGSGGRSDGKPGTLQTCESELAAMVAKCESMEALLQVRRLGGGREGESPQRERAPKEREPQ